MEQHPSIYLGKVKTNNLKSIDVSIPLNKLTVVTGVSGSGKSSLVFDTLYAESYRRFVDSLSSYARQYLKNLPKPDFESISNLPPSVSVKQSRSPAQQRSTVGTLTELSHLIQSFFIHVSEVRCVKCSRIVKKDNSVSIVEDLFRNIQKDEPIVILAPLKQWSSLKSSVLKKQLMEQGLVRFSFEGKIYPQEELDESKIHAYDVVIDRLKINENDKSRIFEDVELALKAGRGFCKIKTTDTDYSYSKNLECTYCSLAYMTPSMALFSFNHPLGACDSCQGYGRVSNIDWTKVFPDMNASIEGEGIAPLNFGSHSEFYSDIKKSAKKNKIDVKKPFKSFTDKEMNWLCFGDGDKFGGIKEYFDWLHSKKYKPHYRIHAARFNKYDTCPTCKGHRYSKDTLVYEVNGKNIAEIHEMNLLDFKYWLDSFLKKRSVSEVGLKEVFEEIYARLQYLSKVGLGYLNLSRVSSSLSGGELQRIHMASCLGSSLTDTMYCLDEPTSGLHARDSQNLLEVIRELRDVGNTVVVVEHDRQVIQGADCLVEIGPGAGHLGGNLNYLGKPRDLELSLYPRKKVQSLTEFVILDKVNTHNLKNIRVQFPLSALTVVCGVSGSGKTSLVQHTLFPVLKDFLEGRPAKSGQNIIGPKHLLKKISEVHFIDQKALARSSRSNIATYLGIYDSIRKLFAKQDRAKELKLEAGAFSFNVPGGRCETCKGLGELVEDLSFLGEVNVQCHECQGKRFNDQVLSITFHGKNLLDVLKLTAAEALELFYSDMNIRKTLELVTDLGLGYMTLGQSTNAFSGGEAQRLKLLSLLLETRFASQNMLLIFDEPTTGLSDRDVLNLWKHLDFLTQKGHTILVIEHHLDMIRHSDWLIEIGPEAADQGGQVVYQGPPNGIHSSPHSRTAPFIKN